MPSIFGNYPITSDGPGTGGLAGNQAGGLLNAFQQQQTPDWANKLGLLSAVLKDASAQFSGREDPGALQAWQQHTQQNQIRQQLLQGMQSSDPAIQKQTAMFAIANGIDPSPWLNLTRPKIEHVGDDLVSVDPFDPTNPKTVRSGDPAPPAGYSRKDGGGLAFIPGGPADPSVLAGRRQAPPGYTFGADNKSLVYIPGGPADPRVAGSLAGARRKPQAATGGPIGNPASLFGPR